MPQELKIAVIIVAGGAGNRLGEKTPKQYLMLDDKSIIQHSISAFTQNKYITHIQPVIAENTDEIYKSTTQNNSKILPPVYGGETRQASVFNGLQAIRKLQVDYVLIHDAARPFIDQETINDMINKLRSSVNAVICGVAVIDTIKQRNATTVTQTLDRNNLLAVQTPQGFNFNMIYDLHNRAQGMEFTDDAGICEDFGVDVEYIIGNCDNFKITTQADLIRARNMANNTKTSQIPDIRIGSGFDVHAFNKCESQENFVTLCGVQIPHKYKLEGHSDADVALHALVDAILGSIAQGDIGQHFPPSDDKWKGCNSTHFVKHAMNLLSEAGGVLNNIDLTIICEAPKIGKYRSQMQDKLAEITGLALSKISVKATTTEKLGFTGRKEGIATQASILTIIR